MCGGDVHRSKGKYFAPSPIPAPLWNVGGQAGVPGRGVRPAVRGAYLQPSNAVEIGDTLCVNVVEEWGP